MRTRSANATIRMVTRQSSFKAPKAEVQKDTVSRRRSPRNKLKAETSPSSNLAQATSKAQPANIGEEKGLLLSRVSDHCIVISVPSQKSNKVSTRSTLDTSPKEKKKKHKKKKKHSKSTNEDQCINSPTNDKAFNKVKKLHKKRHKAWMKMRAEKQEKLAEEKELDHREVANDNLEDTKETIKISSKLFKAKQTLNRNNSCSAVESMEMKTPRKRKCTDKQEIPKLSGDAANFPSLVSPSCYVSLKKMKLDPDGDVKLYNKAEIQYAVDNGSSFPYSQQLSLPAQALPDQDALTSSQESMTSCHTSDLDHNYSADGEESQESAALLYSQNDYESSDNYAYSSDFQIHELAENNIEGLSCVNSTNSFLQRLLTSPSPPKSVQKRKRGRRPKPAGSKVRKSKRQKRKRRQQEKQDKVRCKEDELLNVCT